MKGTPYLIVLAVVTAEPAFAQATPGSYVVSVKGKNRDAANRLFAKLAMYSFQPPTAPHTACTSNQRCVFREDLWYWDQSMTGDYTTTECDSGPPETRQSYCASDRRVGCTSIPCTNSDYARPLLIARDFYQHAPTTLWGTYYVTGNTITVAVGGRTETWHNTWKDSVTTPTLWKIELIDATWSTIGTAFYLSSSLVRNKNNINAGWGLGGHTDGFGVGIDSPDWIQATYDGLAIQQIVGSVASTVSSQQLSLFSFAATSTAGFRMWVDGTDTSSSACSSDDDELYYFNTVSDNSGLLARRLMYHFSHDCNADGDILDSNELGHVVSGLQAINTSGEMRGAVMVQPKSLNGGAAFTAYYFLADSSCDAKCGVDPNSRDGACPGTCY